ncbi:SusD/RagB family nutrient-binding outer membrane lipoprotein [Spirosoma taeanense]|uniref:SusD/RagB family nutrient-binding outer membrane lipoprotein n=1 Tax=Spirosoma taeanense TaxID=2735870 RepID=A0A6M5Y5Z8_9BACT|nr:SusD/RagB family nutrient-binding outer membrane lipoprotein [Spirosoma taeanense]QJW89245.1 SusD/RagB family nutrient-binding outer membrane lipoprotein [Spirosoma taeanense]
MNIYKLIIPTLALVLLLTGCEKSFDELEKDPNRPVNAPASLVLRGILNDMYDASNSPSGFAGVTYSPWGAEQRYNQFYASNYNYYATNEYAWTTTSLNYYTLKDILRMEAEAKRAGAADVNPYSALGKFLRAFFYENMTRRVGDVPLSEALQGQADLTPKYDDQKTVYLQILKWLDEANTDLTTIIARGDNTLAGDFYLNNDLRKWQKVVNTFKLRVLISLSRKEADPDLNIKQKFAEVVANPAKYPVMADMSDNLQFIYNNVTKYPRSQDTFGQNATRENMAKTFVDALVERRDPRIFVVAEPAAARLKAGLKPTDFGAFVGASSGEDLQDMATKALQGEYSFQNRKRYYTTYAGEPVFIIGYPELMFNMAEGINRGWASGNAADFYQKGIAASMNFYGLKDGDNTVTFSHDGGIASFDTYTINFSLSDYLAQPIVKYAGNTTEGLNQILTQKYLAFFQNSGLEAFFNQRRTGVPTFLTGVGTGNSGQIPKRWRYPNNERTTNGENLNVALAAQYGGVDDINATMWLLK